MDSLSSLGHRAEVRVDKLRFASAMWGMAEESVRYVGDVMCPVSFDTMCHVWRVWVLCFRHGANLMPHFVGGVREYDLLCYLLS